MGRSLQRQRDNLQGQDDPRGAARVGATFVPPGTQTNPIPVGTFANIDEGGYFGWRLKVVSTHLVGQNLVLLLSAAAVGSDLWAVQLDANLFLMGRTARCNLPGLTLCGAEYGLWGAGACRPPAPDFFEQGSLTSVVGGARGVAPAQVALAWLLHKPGVTAPIVGATKLGHVEDALAAEQISLSDDEIGRLEERYVPHRVSGIEL